MQTLTTAFILISPFVIACNSLSPALFLLEGAGVCFWIIRHVLENVTDYPKDRFRKSGVSELASVDNDSGNEVDIRVVFLIPRMGCLGTFCDFNDYQLDRCGRAKLRSACC